MNNKPRAKRHPITVRLTDETIQLARSLAKLYMEDEKKLGDLVEEAILFYSANREDQSRTNALLKVTEDNLLNQFKEQVESMYREFKTRDKLLAERVASLIAIQGFESTLVELMLKDLYIKDNERDERYQELRSIAARKMKDRYTKSDMGKMAELTEKITELENKLQSNHDKYVVIVNDKISTIKDLKSDVKNKNNEIKNLNSDLEKTISYAKKLEDIIKWYEERDMRIPLIQKGSKNKIGMKKKYEDIKEIYEDRNQIPDKPDTPKLKSSHEFGLREW